MKSMAAVVADFDRIADEMARDSAPSVLTPAERFLLRHVPPRAQRALDVGCGGGSIARALAERGIATVGIDASPRMISLAKTRGAGMSLLEYRQSDITTDPPPTPCFDVVVAVAMAHHAPLERVVEFLLAAVASGGTLLIQDVIARPGMRHLPVNALAWLARRLRALRGTNTQSAVVNALYELHGTGEEYLRQEEVAEVCHRLLPGARIYHHLEWRYTAIWRS